MEKEQLKDDFLKNLLKSSQAEKPGFDFTAKIMSDIQQLEAEKARNPLWSWRNMLTAVGGGIALVFIYFVISPFLDDSGLVGQGLNPERFGNYFTMILNSFQGFLAIIDFFRESTLTLIILFVILMLILLDSMLKRFSSRTFLLL